MTTINDLLKHCTLQHSKGEITGLQLVKGYENSYALRDGKVIALSLTDENLTTLILDEAASALEYLSLSGCVSLKKITFEGVFNTLTHLYLDNCDLESLVIPDGCDSLLQVYVQNNKLTSLDFQGNCPVLQLLDACNNKLKMFELPIGFERLAFLYLNDNTQLTTLKINVLPSLNTLSIKNTRLIELPSQLILSKSLETLYASGNSPKNIPSVFLSDDESYASQNCIEAARIWFTELRDFDSEKNKIVKLMLTGNGNAGKSSLLCALQQGKCVHDHRSTHAIQIDVVEKDGIQYNVWDFGGQEVYHGTHRLFMESEALQVIVFDPETEALAKAGTLSKDRISDENVLNHPREYWYETVKELSPNSSFIMVQNKKDILTDEDETIRKYAKSNHAKYVHLSARTGVDVDDLEYSLKKEAKELPDFDMSMPISWLKVRDFFIENLKKGGDSQKIITEAEFDALCVSCVVNENTVELLIKYLHNHGYLYRHKNLGDKIIADQRWALEAIYKPLDRKAAHYKEFKEDWKGKIRVARLFEIFGQNYTIDEKWLFLDFMKSCGLCFQLNNKENQHEKHESDVYIFPEFLETEKPQKIINYWERATNMQTLRYKMPWLNYGTIQAFITALGRKTETENVWRNGIHVLTEEGCFNVELDYVQKAIVLNIETAAMEQWLQPIISELKVKHEASQWEISIDKGKTYQLFDAENWKQQRNIKPDMSESSGEKGEKSAFDTLDEKLMVLDRQVILFLAANPSGAKLSLGNEHTHICAKLQMPNCKGKFELIPQFGTTWDNMIDAIGNNRPSIIHFVGHGKENNPDITNSGGLVFHQSDYQGEKLLDPETLNKAFKRIKGNQPQLKIVLLNACYSQPQAVAISNNGIYAIGSSDQISSPAARMFATGFYSQLATENDILKAVDSGFQYALSENSEIEDLISLHFNGNEISI
jgi:GTPase SAR1 family protein